MIFLDDHDETLKRLEASARNMNSLAGYSRSNAINREWVEMYLNEAHSQGLRSVRCHCNVMAWAESEAELKRIRNDVGSQLALMGCTPHHNTVDVPVLFWAAIPGNEADFPAEESFTPSSIRPSVFSTRRPTTARHCRPSESRCPTACRGFRFIWISRIFR